MVFQTLYLTSWLQIDHDDRISSQATSQYDCVVEHPEGNWMMNSRELQYIHQKYPEFMINPKYPDES